MAGDMMTSLSPFSLTEDPKILGELKAARFGLAGLLSAGGDEYSANSDEVDREMAHLYTLFKERFGGHSLSGDVARFAHAVDDFVTRAMPEAQRVHDFGVQTAFVTFYESGRLVFGPAKREAAPSPEPTPSQAKQTRPGKPRARASARKAAGTKIYGIQTPLEQDLSPIKALGRLRSEWETRLGQFSIAAVMDGSSSAIGQIGKVAEALCMMTSVNDGGIERFTEMLVGDTMMDALDALLEGPERWMLVRLSNVMVETREVIRRAESHESIRQALNSFHSLHAEGEAIHRKLDYVLSGLGDPIDSKTKAGKDSLNDRVRTQWDAAVDRYRDRVWKLDDFMCLPNILSVASGVSSERDVKSLQEFWIEKISSAYTNTLGGIAERALSNAAKSVYNNDAFVISGSAVERAMPDDGRVDLYRGLFELALNAENSFKIKRFKEIPEAIAINIEERDGALRISVRDKGVGIEDVGRAMLRGTRERPDAFPGAGMGLPRAADLAEANGWGLEIESEPGVGTTATIVMGLTPALAAQAGTAVLLPVI